MVRRRRSCPALLAFILSAALWLQPASLGAPERAAEHVAHNLGSATLWGDVVMWLATAGFGDLALDAALTAARLDPSETRGLEEAGQLVSPSPKRVSSSPRVPALCPVRDARAALVLAARRSCAACRVAGGEDVPGRRGGAAVVRQGRAARQQKTRSILRYGKPRCSQRTSLARGGSPSGHAFSRYHPTRHGLSCLGPQSKFPDAEPRNSILTLSATARYFEMTSVNKPTWRQMRV